MSLKAAFMVPHPPMIVKEIGKGSEQQVIKTIEAYCEIAKEIEKLQPETIIISSPHAPLYSNGFYLSTNPVEKSSFKKFGVENIFFKEEIDEELVDEIEKLANKECLLTKKVSNNELDHGTMVPLYFIRQKFEKSKIIVIGLAGLPLIEHYKMGMVIKKAIDNLNRNVVYIASGDLSHKLQEYGPYGFIEEGPVYDKKIMDVCRNARFNELLEFSNSFLDKAAECGHRSFTIMAGTMDKLNVEAKEYSHEDITGVGYGICSFYPKEKNEDRCFYSKYLKAEEKRVASEDELVNLAKETIRSYIINNKIIDIPENISKEYLENKAGVFVSIHKFDRLRGCIGTFLPTTNSIAEEVIRNAIEAATNDPRFEKITSEELNYLEIKVDILKTPEIITSKEMLNVKKYGIIVTSGYKRGLLLPDLEGVDTVDKQIEIAMRKGNITKDEDIILERFEVIRHK